MSTLVSVDPGKHACAWALFDDGVLADVGYEPTYSGERFADLVVVELPQVYQQRRQTGDPNALIDVAYAAGRFTASEFFDWSVELIKPRQWKGTRPKHVCNKVTLNALTEEERRLIPDLPKTKLHNVLDAIGIGLWRLGRR